MAVEVHVIPRVLHESGAVAHGVAVLQEDDGLPFLGKAHEGFHVHVAVHAEIADLGITPVFHGMEYGETVPCQAVFAYG